MLKYRLAGLAAGLLIILSLTVAWTLWKAPSSTADNAARKGMGGEVWGANYFPNIPLINHKGERVRFFDDLIKDKVVAINFIYTSCPDACPMETARLQEVKRLLGDRVGKDVFFYSITIDPEYDTPEVLAEYVKRFRLGDGWWFLTGDEDDIVMLRKKFGIYRPEIQSEDSNDHNLSLVIGNQATGRWMKRSPYENPYVLATQLGRWLHNWKAPPPPDRDYADAPKLRQMSTGENLFRTRCSSCHTIGKGDVEDYQRRLVGPDLMNVTLQRDRQWLTRWLMEPDRMLKEKDPLAMQLYKQYDEVPMPNLRLGLADAERILEYIEEESARIERHRRMGHDMSGHGNDGEASGPSAHDPHAHHGKGQQH
ncbi:MAG TPA: SCO family protein [Acidobacteriota bacterium]|nr:SCO family protein [Acidobacteriota bacterium]